MTRRRFVLGALAAPLALRPAAVPASDFGGGRPEERYFSVEAGLASGRRGPVAEGYVTNHYDVQALRVRLALETVDAAGRPVGAATAQVWHVPPRARAFFRTPVPPGAAGVRGHVADFEWAPRGGGAGG